MQHPKTFFIKPAHGLRISDPISGGDLPEAGAYMPRSGFWLRRLKDGDVVEVKQAPAPKAAKKAQEETSSPR